MARPLRIEYPGAWYHVLNRGRRKEEIFFEKSDYQLFMYLLGECSDIFNLEVHAYSLMPNHYHLLICTPEGNLSRIMRHLDGVYTQKINRRHDLEGSLFKGRFKSILIEEKSYLIELIRYIHRNPLKACLESNLGEHEWTSHCAYLKERFKPKWLHLNNVLKYFGKYEKNAKKELHAFVLKESPKDFEARLDGTNWPAVLGCEKFLDKIKNILLGKEINEEEIPQYKENVVRISAMELFGLMIKKFKLDRNKILDKRIQQYMRYKRGFIYACRHNLYTTNTEIKYIIKGVSQSSISKQYFIACNEVAEKKGCYGVVVKLEEMLKCQFKT